MRRSEVALKFGFDRGELAERGSDLSFVARRPSAASPSLTKGLKGARRTLRRTQAVAR
jgi:hypothetical protein